MGWEDHVESLLRRKPVWILFRIGQGIYYGVMGLFALFAISMFGLLAVSLAVHAGQEIFDGSGGAPTKYDYSGYPGPDDYLEYDPTPEKLDGSESQEFEPDDIERAEEAPDEVKEYCAGAVSEAQRIGCESHVEPWEVP